MAYTKTTPRKKWRRVLWAAVVLVPSLAVLDYVFYARLPVGGQSFNRGANGLWLRDSWWRGTEKEGIASLTARLKTQQIRYAYFHVRFIKKDGTLRFRGAEYSLRARKLNAELHRRVPGVKSLAWIYIGNERGLTGVDLSNQKVRRAITKEAAWLIKNCGFDGVQWDYEICENGDADFLKLLGETQSAMPKNKMVSIATAMWLPSGFYRWGWSEEYFSQVAARCDQLVVMGYDSGLYFPRHYVWLMKQQVLRVCRAAIKANPRCRVLIGVPTYEAGGHSHHAHAENLKMAIKAARHSTPHANFDGLAIFADYTTDKDEWSTWRAWWLGRK